MKIKNSIQLKNIQYIQKQEKEPNFKLTPKKKHERENILKYLRTLETLPKPR